MGGEVSIGVRRSDGTIMMSTKWTSAISAFFNNVRFFDESNEHIDKFLTTNKNDGIYPCGYGIVFGDYKTKTIYSNQGYTSVNKIQVASLELGMSGIVITDSPEYLEHNLFDELRLRNFITKCEIFDNSFESKVILIPDHVKTSSDVMRWIKELNISGISGLITDNTGWKIKNYDESLNGMMELFIDMACHSSIDITEESISGIDRWIDEHQYYLEECEPSEKKEFFHLYDEFKKCVR